MNHIRRTCRSLSGLPRRAGLLIATAAPAVLWADPPLPPGWTRRPPLPAHAHTVVIGGLDSMIGTPCEVGTPSAGTLNVTYTSHVHRHHGGRPQPHRELPGGTPAVTSMQAHAGAVRAGLAASQGGESHQ